MSTNGADAPVQPVSFLTQQTQRHDHSGDFGA